MNNMKCGIYLLQNCLPKIRVMQPQCKLPFVRHAKFVAHAELIKHSVRSYVRRARRADLGEISAASVTERDNVDSGKPVSSGTDTDHGQQNIHKQFPGETVEELLNNAAAFEDHKSQGPDDEWATTPYPKGSNWEQSQARYSYRPRCDPQDTTIVLFPGQGLQYVGMGKDLLQYPNVEDMFMVASDILGVNLKTLCLNGPRHELDKTVHCQPATLVCSLSAVEKLRNEDPKAVESCVATAGFSIGEITALVFAGAISFEDAIRIVKVRGEAMQLASEIVASGMMTVFLHPAAKLGYACSVAKEWCKEMKGIETVDCKIANYLYPQCKVIAGNMEALNFIQQNASDFGINRLRKIRVSGAFHTELMSPALKPLQEALNKITIDPPVIPVHSNVNGKMYNNVAHIRRQLPAQICKAVKWEQTMHILYERNQDQKFPRTFECGPGRFLRAILQKVNAKANMNAVSVSA